MGRQLTLFDIRPIVEVFEDCKRRTGPMRLRVRAVDPGFLPDWYVAFPRALRVSGARFRVARLVAVASRRYYRAVGPFEPVSVGKPQ